MNGKKYLLAIFTFIIAAMVISGCSSKKGTKQSKTIAEQIVTNSGQDGLTFIIEFRKGPAHNHPLMAIWLEDMSGNYLETLYVASSIGTGIFGHGVKEGGHWEPGPLKRPAALPYWSHKYGNLPTPENPVPDAITGPTPKSDFDLHATSSQEWPQQFKVLLEINQSWDWNEYWTNDKYPDNLDYKTSSQPALVYEALVDLSQGSEAVFLMEITGHSHYAGEDGELYEDISTLTTAKGIVGVVSVSVVGR